MGLANWIVAQVKTPAHVVAVVGQRAVDGVLSEEKHVAGLHGHRHRRVHVHKQLRYPKPPRALPGSESCSPRRWLRGIIRRQPFSSVASLSGNHTVRTSESSASGRTTPLSWCQLVALTKRLAVVVFWVLGARAA